MLKKNTLKHEEVKRLLKQIQNCLIENNFDKIQIKQITFNPNVESASKQVVSLNGEVEIVGGE